MCRSKSGTVEVSPKTLIVTKTNDKLEI